MSESYNHILSPIQRDILEVFAKLADQQQFYLAGGTALAGFYLGHRLSFDLDLFTGVGELVTPTSYAFELALNNAGFDVTVTRRFASFCQLVVTRADEIQKIDLAYDSPFHLQDTQATSLGIWVASYPDLSADKTLAYFARSEPRDAIDVFFLAQQDGWNVLMQRAAEKDTGFDPYWFAIALQRASKFPDELARWPVKMIREIDPSTLKQQFIELSLEIMAQIDANNNPLPPALA